MDGQVEKISVFRRSYKNSIIRCGKRNLMDDDPFGASGDRAEEGRKGGRSFRGTKVSLPRIDYRR